MTKDKSAKSIWDKRYQDGELACTQKTVESDPIDYTQHPFLYKLSTATTQGWSVESAILQGRI